MIRRVSITACTLLVAGLAVSVPAGDEAVAVNGLIAFEKFGLTHQVWVMDQDGSHPRQLANGSGPA